MQFWANSFDECSPDGRQGPGKREKKSNGKADPRLEARKLAILTRDQLAERLLQFRVPRRACFAFGLRNAGRARTIGRPADPGLAALLREATGQDCLDAAFALAALPSERIAALADGASAAAPPFQDKDYYAAIARWVGCRFDSGGAVRRALALADARITPAADGRGLRVERNGRELYLWAPRAEQLPSFAALVAAKPAAARLVAIVPPAAFAGLSETRGPEVVTGRLDPLHAIAATVVADSVTTPAQTIALAAIGALALGATVAAPIAAFGFAVTVVTAILLGYAASRGLAIWTDPHVHPPRRALPRSELPVYSILLPLYHEGGDGLAELVRALHALDYPVERLDIQFLVEADDEDTRRALEMAARDLPCRITVVPEGSPRTKPRALNVGLRQARGRLVTIFDAEDRPDPAQLRIAAETFAAAPRDLAALQARLHVDHPADSWLTRMFAIEYACQFDHVLPMVSSRGGLILLGGTSNHFRAEALTRVGGWDPYNVTEDADLAVRLRRFGYRIATIDSETHEEAPMTVAAWLKQRARWFKGYMQTWLVHNRRPISLVREIGWRDAFLFHLFIIGALTAALSHIAFLLQLVLKLAGVPVLVGGSTLVAAAQMAAILAGYGASLALGAVSVRRRRDPRFGPGLVVTLPLYWLLMGAAVLIAMYDLVRRPHHWHKTRHGLAARPRRRHFGWTTRFGRHGASPAPGE